MAFSYNTEELLQDPLILSRLKEYFPNASMEDYELYLNQITRVGCGYTAMVNTIFVEYEGREEEFKRKFGFPMYTIDDNGNIDYNYEYLILDYFNYVWGNSGHPIQILYGNASKYSVDGAISSEENNGFAGGTNDERFLEFSDFLREKYNVNCNVNAYSSNYEYINYGKVTAENAADVYNMITLDGRVGQVVITAEGYDLYNMDGSRACENGGSHAMYITGVDAEGNFIVSSWGSEYTLNLDEVADRDGYIAFKIVTYA